MGAKSILEMQCATLGGVVARRNMQMAGRVGVDLPREDIRHLAHVAVFLAFCELGGSPERAEEFAWDTRTHALVRRANQLLRRELRSRGSDYYETARRMEYRRTGEPWDAWLDSDTLEDRETRELMLHNMAMLVRDVLTDQDYFLVEQVYLGGRKLVDVAEELAGTDLYPGDVSIVYNRIKVRLMRIRDRLRVVLTARLDAA